MRLPSSNPTPRGQSPRGQGRLAALVTLALLTLTSTIASAITQAEVDAVIGQIDAATIDASGVVVAAGMSLQAGPGRLIMRTGRIYPAGAVIAPGETAAVPREFVFVGEGILDLDPADAIESRQLEIYTGGRSVHEAVTAAVIVVANDAAAATIRTRPRVATAEGAGLDRARDLLATWRASPERQILGVREAILADALRETGADHYFAGAFEGKRLGRFLFAVEPRSTEQVSLGSFEPVELTDKERRKIDREVHREQRRGRLLGFSEDSLGRWDSWLSMPLQRDGARAEGRPSFEPEHYEIEAEVGSAGDTLDGRARVRLVATGDGSRVATFDLMSDLLVSAALQGERTPAPFLQSDGRISVVLDHAPSQGETIEVELRYRGQAFEQNAARSFQLRDSLMWYPHAGEADLATYDVLLRWPRRWDLLAAGKIEGEGTEGSLSWRRRVLTRPTKGYTFQFGQFEKLEKQVGAVHLVLAIDAASRSVLTGRQALLDAIADAVAFLSGVFGPLPCDELVVVTNQSDFSQSMLGFVTLSLDMTRDDELSASLGAEDPLTIIAHEISHQWWGHLVSWGSYRDQWLSEALADYSSAYYARERLADRKDAWRGPLTDWQDDLAAIATTGQSVESLGPVVLGERLDSSLSEDAYQSIVYTKGALVLNLLAQRVGEEGFHTILRWLAQKAGGRAVTTEDFLKVVADASKLDLAPFANAFIYGTGVPELEYSYRAVKAGDSAWRVAIEVARTPAFHFTYRVTDLADQRFDVRREVRADEMPSPEPALVVPFEVALRDAATSARPGKKQPQTKTRAAGVASSPNAGSSRGTGSLLLEGEHSTIDLELPAEPETLTLDPEEILLGNFYDVTHPDKEVLLRRGHRSILAGEPAAAESSFRQAIETVPGNGGEADDEAVSAGRIFDVIAHLELARLALDAGTDGEAESRIQLAKAALKKVEGAFRPLVEPEIVLVESRLDLRRGDSPGVARRLARLWDDGVETAEGLLLLAIAAKETGDNDLFAEALEASEKRRAEITDLGGLRAPPG